MCWCCRCVIACCLRVVLSTCPIDCVAVVLSVALRWCCCMPCSFKYLFFTALPLLFLLPQCLPQCLLLLLSFMPALLYVFYLCVLCRVFYCVYSLRARESRLIACTRVLLLGWYNYKGCVLLGYCAGLYCVVLLALVLLCFIVGCYVAPLHH